jgi:hypothetical protein
MTIEANKDVQPFSDRQVIKLRHEFGLSLVAPVSYGAG